MKTNAIPIVVATLAAAVLLPWPVGAAPATLEPEEYARRIAVSNAPPPVRPVLTAAQGKMDFRLASLFPPAEGSMFLPGESASTVKSGMSRLGQLRARESVDPPGTVDSDLLYVYVRVNPGATLENVRGACFGATDERPEWNLLAGWMEEEQVPVVAEWPEVAAIRLVYPPRFRTGSVTSAGDALHHGPQARSNLGLDGQPIPVGVISDGVSNAAAAQAGGDLPPALLVLNPGSGDEGTAMLEIIHDIAPGAPLSFHAAGTNTIAFANAISALAAAGNKVICDDVGWYTDPYFEQSPLGVHIAGLRAAWNYVHVSAAGNDGRLHHQQGFTDTSPVDGWHDPILYATIPPAGTLDVFMQWDESLAAVPASDYDLYLYDYNNLAAGPIAWSAASGIVGETICFTNSSPGTTITAAVYLWKSSGANRTVEMFLEPQNGSSQFTNGTSAVDAVFGHPAHPGVIAVGATDVATPDAIEADSSQGPFTTIGPFPPGAKPDVAAADGVAVSGAGGFATPFFGTSAAAPHVAGLCALAWHRSPGLPADALAFALTAATAAPACLDLPSTAPDGPDLVFGHGRPLADAWALLLNRPPSVTMPSGTWECAPQAAEAISGVAIADPDAGTAAVAATFSATHGVVTLNPMVPGGLTPLQIAPGGTPGSVVATAALAAINTTLAAADGLLYQANGPIPPGTTVADALTVTVNDQGNTGAGTFPLAGTGSTGLRVHEFAYYAWLHDHFDAAQLANPLVSGDQSDPDADFYGNIWEFLMGADPWVADAAGAIQSAASGGQFLFSYRIASSTLPQWHAIVQSRDLVQWNQVSTGITTTPHPTIPGCLQVTLTWPMSSGSPCFFRILLDPRK